MREAMRPALVPRCSLAARLPAAGLDGPSRVGVQQLDAQVGVSYRPTKGQVGPGASVSKPSVGLPFVHLAVGQPANRRTRRWTQASGSAGRNARTAAASWPSAGLTGTPSRSTALVAAYCA